MRAMTKFVQLDLQEIFEDEENREWFSAIGRHLISSLLLNAQRVRRAAIFDQFRFFACSL